MLGRVSGKDGLGTALSAMGRPTSLERVNVDWWAQHRGLTKKSLDRRGVPGIGLDRVRANEARNGLPNTRARP